MFERYTEPARRTLFFSRYEASQLGDLSIGTEHLLLGLTRESHGVVASLLAMSNISPGEVRKEIEKRAPLREKVSTSVEIPFNQETRSALIYAAEEADRLRHHDIGPEHLLLGLLREERSVAGAILTTRGLRLDDARDQIVKFIAERPAVAPPPSVGPELLVHIDRIKDQVAQLAALPSGSSESQALADLIRGNLDALKRHLGG